MKKIIFIIAIFIALITLHLLNVKEVYPQNIKCHKGYVRDYYNCKNPTTALSYREHNDGTNTYYLNNIWCGNNCNYDGKNCKLGVCDQKEITSYGYTEIKDKKFYNPKTHLSYEGDNFYLNNISCGFGCNLNGKNCKSGICDKNELNNYGFTKIEDEKFYNPDNYLSFKSLHSGSGDYIIFYLNNIPCGHGCNLDGKNCEVGFCDKNELINKGFVQKNKGFYNSKKDTYIYYDTLNQYALFTLNNVECGFGCNLDGKNCKSGFCNKNELTNKGFQCDIKYKRFYNPKSYLSYNYLGDFYIDAYKDKVKCGYGCDLEGKNCKKGNCDFNAIKKHGYQITKSLIEHRYTISNGYYAPKSSRKFSYGLDNRFYNPKTHISFDNDYFYLEDIACGFNCDLDGRNCEKGVCVVDDCRNGYKKLDILTTKNWTWEMSPIPYIRHTKSIVCHNNFKYYNVFEPNITQNAIFRNIKPVK